MRYILHTPILLFIPQELADAAVVDGASPDLIYGAVITLPILTLLVALQRSLPRASR